MTSEDHCASKLHLHTKDSNNGDIYIQVPFNKGTKKRDPETCGSMLYLYTDNCRPSLSPPHEKLASILVFKMFDVFSKMVNVGLHVNCSDVNRNDILGGEKSNPK